MSELRRLLMQARNDTPQWMLDAVATYGIPLENIKNAIEEYDFVDNINTNQARFPSGVVYSDNTKSCSIYVYAKYYGPLFGAQNGENRTFCYYNNKVYCGNGANRVNIINSSTSFIKIGVEYDSGTRGLTTFVNNNEYDSKIQTGTFSSNSISIGGINNTQESSSAMYIKWAILKSDKYDFVGFPCLRKNDGEIGFINLINYSFCPKENKYTPTAEGTRTLEEKFNEIF